jgi:hypothetical protein
MQQSPLEGEAVEARAREKLLQGLGVLSPLEATAIAAAADVAELASAFDDRLSSAPPHSSLGKSIALGLGAALALGAIFSAPFMITPFLSKARYGNLPFYPTSLGRVRRVLDAVEPLLSRGASGALASDARLGFVDLGSGHGVAVLEAARRGMRARGVELNYSLVLVSRARAALARMRARGPFDASFAHGNLFDFPLAGADVVFVFGVPPIMDRVARKVVGEAPNALFVSHKFAVSAAALAELRLGEVAVLDDVLVYAPAARAAEIREALR